MKKVLTEKATRLWFSGCFILQSEMEQTGNIFCRKRLHWNWDFPIHYSSYFIFLQRSCGATARGKCYNKTEPFIFCIQRLCEEYKTDEQYTLIMSVEFCKLTVCGLLYSFTWRRIYWISPAHLFHFLNSIWNSQWRFSGLKLVKAKL